MSERALEFVETWVSEKIEEEGYPDENDEAVAKAWAAECLEAANEEGIPSEEIGEAFDDLAEFIEGEFEEARERENQEDEEDDDEEDDNEEDDEGESDEDSEDNK
jgi:hypothetical protein